MEIEAWREGGVNVFIRPAPPTDREGWREAGPVTKPTKKTRFLSEMPFTRYCTKDRHSSLTIRRKK